MKKAKIVSVLFAIVLLLFGVQFTAMAAQDESIGLALNYSITPGCETHAGIMVENKDTKSHHYNLQVSELPEGFKTHFLLEGKLTEAIDLKPYAKHLIELGFEAPEKIQKDSGIFKIKLMREDGIESFFPVSFTVNRDFALKISSEIKKLEIMNGKSTSFDIAVANSGNKELKDLKLKVDLPYKWSLENVTPNKLTLKPGENGLFKLNVFVPSTQASGNFTIKIKSLNKDTAGSEISMPITVTASIGYAWWTIGLVLLAGLVTVLYFCKHGRR